MRTLSFLELFKTEKLDIEIPMLQRDYAQGRENANTKKIRERFLEITKIGRASCRERV